MGAKYIISVKYTANTLDKISFPIPMEFSYLASHAERLGHFIYQIGGNTGVGNAVDILLAFCEQLVNDGKIKGNFMVEVEKL